MLTFRNKKTKNEDLTLIVCSCDSYSDVWYAYFEMFRKNWSGFRYPIILNTETKSYSHPGLDIKCLQLYNEDNAKDASWTDRMIRTLEYVDSDYVMLTCEDNFIVSPVDNNEFQKAFDIIKKSRRISMLSFAGKTRGDEKTKWIGNFGRVSMKKRYRVVLDTAIWRKDALLRNLIPGESPWEFEVNGTERALWDFTEYYRYKDYEEIKSAEPIVNVPFTSLSGVGITGGKWRWRNPELFAEYGIPMDFSKRGIIDKETSIEESKRAIAFSEEYRNTIENNKGAQIKSQLVRRLPQNWIRFLIKIWHFFVQNKKNLIC